MRLTTTAALALAALALAAGGAGAYTLGGWQYGDAMPLCDARALAMGGAGLASADGARGAGLNPALVAKTQGIEASLSLLGVSAEEAREAPLYDSFDGIIGYNTYAWNSNLYDRYVGTVAVRSGGLRQWPPAFAIGYRPLLDMSYAYHVQYRNDDDLVDHDSFADGDGGVNAFTVTVAEEVWPQVFVGLGVDFLNGSYDTSARDVYPYSDDDTESTADFDDLSGTRFTAGVLVERLHRLDVGLVYRGGFEVAGDYSLLPDGAEDAVTGTFRQDYPDAFALGFEYHPRNEIMTTVSFDVEYTRWSDFEDSMVDDVELDDTVEYRVGVEHQFYNRSHARFGFAYQPAYFDERTTRAAFSGGLGVDVLGVRLDVSGQIGVRQYDIDLGRVRETTTLAMATLVHRF
jgi:hypothetical protein